MTCVCPFFWRFFSVWGRNVAHQRWYHTGFCMICQVRSAFFVGLHKSRLRFSVLFDGMATKNAVLCEKTYALLNCMTRFFRFMHAVLNSFFKRCSSLGNARRLPSAFVEKIHKTYWQRDKKDYNRNQFFCICATTFAGAFLTVCGCTGRGCLFSPKTAAGAGMHPAWK